MEFGVLGTDTEYLVLNLTSMVIDVKYLPHVC